MSMDFSRRQSLKLAAGAGLLAVMPLSSATALVPEHVYVVTREGSAGADFEQYLKESLEISSIRIERNNYDSILTIANLPKGSLLLGLVSEAEKVLIDAAVYDRRGFVHMTARKDASISGARIGELADLTAQAASARSQGMAFEKAHDPEITKASLISFYAYL